MAAAVEKVKKEKKPSRFMKWQKAEKGSRY